MVHSVFSSRSQLGYQDLASFFFPSLIPLSRIRMGSRFCLHAPLDIFKTRQTRENTNANACADRVRSRGGRIIAISTYDAASVFAGNIWRIERIEGYCVFCWCLSKNCLHITWWNLWFWNRLSFVLSAMFQWLENRACHTPKSSQVKSLTINLFCL